MQDRPELDHAIEALQRLSELFQTRRRQLAEEVGITESQWRVLEEIAEEHFMPSLFARERRRTPAAVSRTLRALAEEGLVDVTLSADDARRRIYRLTAKGRKLQNALRERRQQAISEVWGDFSDRDLRGFIRFADALGGRLEEYTRSR
jgi:DNA-binding MarR family transcriptional regulator